MKILNLKNNKNKTIVLGLLSLVLIHSLRVQAYIPELSFILKKSSLTTGKKIIQIEQEVIFKIGEEEARVDETWLIEGDRNLKLAAYGKNLFKESIRLNYLYNGQNKTYFFGKNKIVHTVGSDFFERYLFIRSKDSFLAYLKELGIVTNLKLSRADGVVSFLVGEPSDQFLNPQIWIGQDDFAIRKIRTPSAAEITLGQITELPGDTLIAKNQIISWPVISGSTTTLVTVQVRVKKIDLNAAGSISSFYPQNIEFPSELSFSNKTSLTHVIEEFYTRFR